MSSNRKKVEPPQEEGAPAWMNTYGDMVTLVLTFFVLLFSFSTVDAKKWEAIVRSFAGSRYVAAIEPVAPVVEGEGESDVPLEDLLGQIEVGEEDGQAAQGADANGGDVEGTQNGFDALYEKIKTHIETNNLGSRLHVVKEEGIILLRITDSALFDSGKAVIKPDAVELLNSVSIIFKEYTDSIRVIRVEGNTDNVPISTSEFKSNWELSTARAVNVVNYIFSVSDIDPTKFYVGGYGEFKPVADNDTPEGRAQNRRVDFVLESYTSDK